MAILSGIQPSGDLHLGNYLGAVRQWVQSQNSDAYFSIVDLHSLTLPIDPEVLRRQTLDLAATLFAAGLDPEICTIFVQSHVPYHAQLSWLLECVTSYGELTRMVAFKEKSARQDGNRVGLLTYPVLMMADILLYEATEVPVGDDQRQHLELTREVVTRFNNRYGDTFQLPIAVQPPVAARVMDLQQPTRKMSKSVSSPLGTIKMMDAPNEIRRKVMKAVTDTDDEVSTDWDKKPGLTNLIEIFCAVTSETPIDIANRYGRYGDLKRDLADALIGELSPIRERYTQLRADEETLYELLDQGRQRATLVAQKVYERAADAIGLLSPRAVD